MTTGAFYGYYNSKEELFAVLSVLVYIAGLMCSHMAAFRITTNLRIAMTDHIATLPLGQMEQMGSGKLRRTISDTSGAAETYLAHQLPDQAKAYASMMGMAGKGMQEKMTQYQNALAAIIATNSNIARMNEILDCPVQSGGGRQPRCTDAERGHLPPYGKTPD